MRLLNWIQHLFQHDKTTLARGGLLGIVGFLLSPLSWWNDLLINLPAAYVFAYAVTYVLQPIAVFSVTGFMIWIGIGYWLSNILGFYLLHLSAKDLFDAKSNHVRDLAIAVAYTLAILLIASYGFSEPIRDSIHLVPHWIQAD